VTTINELVNEALVAYAELAGLNPKRWDDQKVIKALNQSRELDPRGVTTFMMLRGLMDNYIDSTTFTAKMVLLERDRFDAEIARTRAVLDMVEHERAVAVVEEFLTELRLMADAYEFEKRDEFEALLADKYEMAHVRRDALRSIETLEAHQFTQGLPDTATMKVGRYVYEFWNINSVLAGLRAQSVPGVALCLIRDPAHVMASYFVFAVCNGGTMTILTDRHKGPHPDYYGMSRGRGARDLLSRAERNRFPYRLLELEFHGDESPKNLYAKDDWLVPINVEAVKVCPLGALEPDEFVWAGLVLDLIERKYGVENTLVDELSYTGEMVVNPTALVSADSALVRAGQYRPLEVAPFKREDVTAETTAPQWERKSSRFNEWMVERYGETVPEDVLNAVGDKALKLLEAKYVGELTQHQERRIQRMMNPDESVLELRALNPVTFGSKEKLEKDRMLAARVSQCRVIQFRADAEYKAERENVIRWCHERVKANRQFLLEAAARGTLMLPDVSFKSREESGFPVQDDMIHREKEAARVSVGNKFSLSYGDWVTEHSFLLGSYVYKKYSRNNGWKCAVEAGVRASLFARFEPTCPEALAVLFGVKVDELPWALQNWYAHEPYTGNSILDRLDPSDWVLDNPWRKEKMTVYVALSKAAANEMRARLGLPKMDWNPTKED
jgi:hypothetical protein